RVEQNALGRAILTDNTGYTQALSVWVRDEITSGRWTVVPGLRVEAINNSFTNRIVGAKQDNDYLVALPGVGALYRATDSIDLIAGAHRGFSPAVPSLTDGLDAEESVNYEFGARWRSAFGRFEAIGFLNDYSNLTAVCTISAGCTPDELDTQTNAGEVRTQGVEFGWNHTIEPGVGAVTIPLAFTYTYTQAEFQEDFISTNPQFGIVQSGFELPYIPPQRANLTVGVNADNWGVNASISYIDRMRDVAGTGDFAADQGSDDTTIVDLAAHYDISDRWTVSGRIDNVFDEVYVVSRRPFGARPGKPLSVQLMVAFNL
ncbi:MAG: TonB-dependent receptor, partial [Pseudomonadota bacterium]